MKKILTGLLILVLASVVFASSDPIDRFYDAYDVLNELSELPDSGAFAELLSNAKGIVFYPSMIKAGLLVGGQYGEGFLVRKDSKTGTWYGPLFLKLYGLSYGFQAGVQSTGLVLVIMNDKGFEGFMGDNITLGGSASIAAGPTGRSLSAETDSSLKASIYSYSVSKGFFAGLTLDGSVVKQDKKVNRSYYGGNLYPETIINERVATDRDLLKVLDLVDKIIEDHRYY